MPYRTEVPGFVKKRPKEDQEQWLGIWNETFEKTGRETDAYLAANKALKFAVKWSHLRRFASDTKVFPTIEFFVSDVFPEWDVAGVYKVQYLRTGLWECHPEYGDILLTNADFAEGLKNFRTSSRKPFLDDDHGITNPEWSSNPGVSFGWMRDLWVEDLNGNKLEPDEILRSEGILVMFAEYEVNEQANEWLKEKKKPLFSPTFHPVYFNKETGKLQGMTVLGGAMTATPYFDGMREFLAVAASERMKASAFSDLLPKASICVSMPQGMSSQDAVSKLDAMGFDVTSIEYWTLWAVAREGGDLASKLGELEGAGFSVCSFYQGVREYSQRGQDSPGGKKSQADAVHGGSGNTNQGEEERSMPQAVLDRLRLTKVLKMSESVSDAELEEKLASLVALSEKAPKPGEVVITAAELKELKDGMDLARQMAKTNHEERKARVIQAAINDFKIRKADQKKWEERYDKDPVQATEILAEMEPNEEFRKGGENGTGGTAGPGMSIVGTASGSRTMMELNHLTQEAMKANTKLDEVAARKLVFGRRPDLYEAYRQETTRHGKGGGR